VDQILENRRSEVYRRIAEISQEATRSRATFTGLVTPAPRVADAHEWKRWESRHEILRTWQRRSMELLAASVEGDAPPDLARSFLDHLPDNIGWTHHRGLPLRCVGMPVFFRTDQASDGTILEVQCPGSLWGVHEILFEWFVADGSKGLGDIRPLSAEFTRALWRHVGGEPIVHHLLDNASHPAGERFFIQRARRGIRYFGFDEDVRPHDCNFVRAHDFLTLCYENFAKERTQRLANGDSPYDLPPVALFDQKLLLALPFAEETRDHFSDEVRALFPFTTSLTPKGLLREDGEWLSIEQFARLPRSQRCYFLKYAGSDVSMNWGSRAVFHLGKLSHAACESRLRSALERYSRGERWILQQECDSEMEVEFVTRDGEISLTAAHSKHSVFYGPRGPLGQLDMFERFYKVHGSSETVTSISLHQGSGPRRADDDEVRQRLPASHGGKPGNSSN